RPECLAGGPLELDQLGQVVGAASADALHAHAARPTLCSTSSSTIECSAVASRWSLSAPEVVNAWRAAATGRAVSRTSAPIVLRLRGRSGCAQTGAKVPVRGRRTTAGVPRRQLWGTGREAQSRGFLSAPGIEPLYSGVAITTASAWASARRSPATDGGAKCPS